MALSSRVTLIRDVRDLGALIRARRQEAGRSLRQAAPAARVGVRFLAEVERGKDRAAIGKVFDTLHSLGLDVAIIPRADRDHPPSGGYSRLLGTEFPYDWSNSRMTPAVFIRKVLEAGRFMDLLRTVRHFGFDAVEREMSRLNDPALKARATAILSRIHAGRLQAQPPPDAAS